MNRQEKITFLNDLRAGKVTIESLSNDSDRISKASLLELKILKDITLKPGNSNQAKRLAELLALNLTEQERLFIERLIEETAKRPSGYVNSRGSDLLHLPLEEKLSIYFNEIYEYSTNTSPEASN